MMTLLQYNSVWFFWIKDYVYVRPNMKRNNKLKQFDSYLIHILIDCKVIVNLYKHLGIFFIRIIALTYLRPMIYYCKNYSLFMPLFQRCTLKTYIMCSNLCGESSIFLLRVLQNYDSNKKSKGCVSVGGNSI